MDKRQQSAALADSHFDERLIERLLEAHRSRLPFDIAGAPGLKPANLAAAYVAQARCLQRILARAGGRQTGHKLGATSRATMKALGFDTPFSGPIADIWTHASPATQARNDFFMCFIELEVGVRLGADLADPDMTENGLRDAIATVFPVMELADTRYAPGALPDATTIVADLGNAGALIVGEPCANWRNLDLDNLPVRLLDGDAVAAEGGAALVLDGPLGQLLRFARQRAREGRPLRAGEIISTGSCIPPFPAQAGRHYRGQLGGLGEVALTLT